MVLQVQRLPPCGFVSVTADQHLVVRIPRGPKFSQLLLKALGILSTKCFWKLDLYCGKDEVYAPGLIIKLGSNTDLCGLQ